VAVDQVAFTRDGEAWSVSGILRSAEFSPEVACTLLYPLTLRCALSLESGDQIEQPLRLVVVGGTQALPVDPDTRRFALAARIPDQIRDMDGLVAAVNSHLALNPGNRLRVTAWSLDCQAELNVDQPDQSTRYMLMSATDVRSGSFSRANAGLGDVVRGTPVLASDVNPEAVALLVRAFGGVFPSE